MTTELLTIGTKRGDGWEAVNDAGQRRVVPASALGALRDVRAGQRVCAHRDADGTIVRVELP